MARKSRIQLKLYRLNLQLNFPIKILRICLP